MANITDSQSILFVNNKARPLADKIIQMYWFAKSVLQQYNSTALLTSITNDASVIIDGAASDGRTIITGGDVVILLSLAQGIINTLEANTNLQLNQISKPSVNKLP